MTQDAHDTAYRFKKGDILYSIGGVEQARYEIQDLINGGKHGRSYVAHVLPAQDSRRKGGNSAVKRVFVKAPCVNPERFDFHSTNRLFQISQTFLREYQNRYRLEDISGVAKIIGVGFYEFKSQHCPVIFPFLVQEFIDGINLSQWLDNQARRGAFTGFTHQDDWFKTALPILRSIKRVHNRNVVHGDLWPENILVSQNPESGEPDFVLVDFGQSFLIDTDPYGNPGDIAEHRYLAPERRRSDNRKWYVPADIYSIGGILFYLATGENPPAEPIRDTEHLKAFVVDAINQRNPNLLKENPGIAKIIDKCLRYPADDRYPYVESILSACEVFSPQPTVEANSIGNGLDRLKTEIQDLTKNEDYPVFSRYALLELDMLSKRIASMNAGHLEIIGQREDLINSLLQYMGLLQEGDIYITVTLAAYWTEHNIGINGRFLTMNKILAKRGVIMRRVFTLGDSELSKAHVRRIMRKHIDTVRELADDAVDVQSAAIPKPGSTAKSYYTGYKIVQDAEVQALIETGDHVAIWKTRDGSRMMSIIFIVDSNGRIGKIRFWASGRQNSKWDEFVKQVLESENILDLEKELTLPGGAGTLNLDSN